MSQKTLKYLSIFVLIYSLLFSGAGLVSYPLWWGLMVSVILYLSSVYVYKKNKGEPIVSTIINLTLGALSIVSLYVGVNSFLEFANMFKGSNWQQHEYILYFIISGILGFICFYRSKKSEGKPTAIAIKETVMNIVLILLAIAVLAAIYGYAIGTALRD